MNSIKHTLSTLTNLRLDCLPRAKTIPKGSEHAILVTPIIKVNIAPPNKFVSISSKPKKPPFINMKAKKGSIGFILGQTWHQIGRNINNKSRWSIIIHYKRWWIKPSTDFTKCGKTIFNKLNSNQKKLFGFTSISPKFNLKNSRKNYKTLRKIKNIPKDYKKSLLY